MKFLIGLNLLLNSALLLLSQSGTVDAQDFLPCQAEDVMGKVYYTATATSDGPICIKFDLSIGGSIEADFGNFDCNDPFVLDATYGTLSSTTGNVATYTPDAGGWSGQVTFKEAPVQYYPSKTVLELSRIDFTPKTFEAVLYFDSCTAPSVSPTSAPTATPTCPIEEFVGKTYYAPLLPNRAPCVKIDLFSGGTASIDPSNVDCASPYNEVPANVYSTFDMTSDNKALFDGTFTGEVTIEESMTGSVGIEAKLKSFDPSNTSWSLALVVNSCMSPSIAPTPSPTLSDTPSPTPQPIGWTQIGQDINAEGTDDRFGIEVSLSSDGHIVAVGGYNNDGNGPNAGHVRVFKYDSGADTWTQLGFDIDGERAGDYSGSAVSLSGDGKRVAIGAYRNDGVGPDSGHVRVYEYENGIWRQLGVDFDGSKSGDYFGRSVSLSYNGDVLAIGANKNDNNGKTDVGHVKVFHYDSLTQTWNQLGANINGESAGDESGRSVSLSGNGYAVAIGADNNRNGRGQVRVYEYDDVSNTWSQLGADIDGESTGDNSGRSVSLSGSGRTAAIGAPFNDGNGPDAGHVRVYEYDIMTEGWTQLGQDIDGENPGDYFGESVSLSSMDGATVAIGAKKNDGNGPDAGHVRVYRYDFSTKVWTQLGQDIDGEDAGDFFGRYVSLNIDGTTVAIGAPRNSADLGDSHNGHVRIYEI